MAQQLRGKEKLQDFRESYDGMSLAGEQTNHSDSLELNSEELHIMKSLLTNKNQT